MYENILTQEYLKSILNYDPETGLFKWKVKRGGYSAVGEIAGHLHPSGYWKLKIKCRQYMAHRVAWLYMIGKWPNDCIDHINRIKDDNRFCNLRDVTAYENSQNVAQRVTSSIVPGIRKYNEKYLVNISTPEHRIYIGIYNNFADANHALTETRLKLYEKPDYSIASDYMRGML